MPLPPACLLDLEENTTRGPYALKWQDWQVRGALFTSFVATLGNVPRLSSPSAVRHFGRPTRPRCFRAPCCTAPRPAQRRMKLQWVHEGARPLRTRPPLDLLFPDLGLGLVLCRKRLFLWAKQPSQRRAFSRHLVALLAPQKCRP